MNIVNYAPQFQSRLDEMYRHNAKTSGIAGVNLTFIGTNTIKLPEIAVPRFGPHGRNGGWNEGSLLNGWTPYKLEFDRDISWLIDVMDVEESNMTLAAARVTSQFELDAGIPEMDTFSLSRLIERALNWIADSAKVPGQAGILVGADGKVIANTTGPISSTYPAWNANKRPEGGLPTGDATMPTPGTGEPTLSTTDPKIQMPTFKSVQNQYGFKPDGSPMTVGDLMSTLDIPTMVTFLEAEYVRRQKVAAPISGLQVYGTADAINILMTIRDMPIMHVTSGTGVSVNEAKFMRAKAFISTMNLIVVPEERMGRVVDYAVGAKVLKPADIVANATFTGPNQRVTTITNPSAANSADAKILAATKEKIQLILSHPSAVARPIKRSVINFMAPGQHTKGDGYWYSYRRYMDLFVLKNKVPAIKYFYTAI